MHSFVSTCNYNQRSSFAIMFFRFSALRSALDFSFPLPLHNLSFGFQDANDALDKCDRLILAKKQKSSQDKSEQRNHVEPIQARQLNGAQAHTSRKDQKQQQQLRQQRENNHKTYSKSNNNSEEKNKLSSYFDIKTSEEGQEPVSHKVVSAAKGKKTKAVQTDLSLRAPTSSSSTTASKMQMKERQQQHREKQKSQSHSCKCNQVK